MTLGTLAIVAENMSPTGCISITGNTEQLAPITTLKSSHNNKITLHHSILSHLIRAITQLRNFTDHRSIKNCIVQLTDNFRSVKSIQKDPLCKLNILQVTTRNVRIAIIHLSAETLTYTK